MSSSLPSGGWIKTRGIKFIVVSIGNIFRYYCDLRARIIFVAISGALNGRFVFFRVPRGRCDQPRNGRKTIIIVKAATHTRGCGKFTNFSKLSNHRDLMSHFINNNNCYNIVLNFFSFTIFRLFWSNHT